LVAFFLHNFEEGLTYSATKPEATRIIRRFLPAAQLPTPTVFQWALLLLTIVAGAALLWAARTRRDRVGWLVVKVIAAIMMANVMIPHVPAAIILGGYAPGIVTAVTINLPLSLWILLRGGASR